MTGLDWYLREEWHCTKEAKALQAFIFGSSEERGTEGEWRGYSQVSEEAMLGLTEIKNAYPVFISEKTVIPSLL